MSHLSDSGDVPREVDRDGVGAMSLSISVRSEDDGGGDHPSLASTSSAAPPASLQRGHKRKDLSLDEAPTNTTDAVEALQAHYAARARKVARYRRSNSLVTRYRRSSSVIVAPTESPSEDDEWDLTATRQRASSASDTASTMVLQRRLSAAALMAAAAAAVEAPVKVESLVPRPPSALTHALPFLLHMLDVSDLLRSARVSHRWHVVAQAPIVWNSSSALVLEPSSLARAASHPILRNAKRLVLGRGTASLPTDECVTRDAHLARHLLAFPQLASVELAHLELEHLFSLTPELGSLGRRLTHLTVRHDSSLACALQKREQLQASWAREDSLVATIADHSTNNNNTSHRVLPLDLAPPTSAPAASILVSPTSSSRRLPSLYSFISLLSLLPNLRVLRWHPLVATDFLHPNLPLVHLHTLIVSHPHLRPVPVVRPLADLLAEAADDVARVDDDTDAAPQDDPSRLREKTPAQVAFLRHLPCLTHLDWPGWSLVNVRALCMPVLPPGTAHLTKTTSANAAVSRPPPRTSMSARAPSPTSAPVQRLLPPRLQTLVLLHDVLTDAHMHWLARVPSLTSLAICVCDTGFTDAGMQSLCSLELLQHLTIKGVRGVTGVQRTAPGDRAVHDPNAVHGHHAHWHSHAHPHRHSSPGPAPSTAPTTPAGMSDVDNDGVATADEDADADDDRGGGLVRQHASIVSLKSQRDRRSAVRSVSMRQAESDLDAPHVPVLASSHVSHAWPASSAGSAVSSSGPSARGRSDSPRTFADLEVVRLASLCSLRSIALESIDIGRDGFHTITHSLGQLTALDLKRMDLPVLHSMGWLTRLRRIGITECGYVRDSTLARTLRSLHLLQEVRVRRCVGVSRAPLAPLISELERAEAAGLPLPTSPLADAAPAPSPVHVWPHLRVVEYEPADPMADAACMDEEDEDDDDDDCSLAMHRHRPFA